MKLVRDVVRLVALVALATVVALQWGCATATPRYVDADDSMINDGTINTMFRPGDKVMIDFADNPSMPSPWPQTVREDGTITLPMNQTIVAAGKRKGELEQEIHGLYVPKLLRRLTVNVRPEERTYFVRGEVKQPGQRPHTGSITALKAISAAGDFTDFANRKRVEVIRADGQKVMLNARKALQNPSRYDVPVYPNDTVYVHRRFF